TNPISIRCGIPYTACTAANGPRGALCQGRNLMVDIALIGAGRIGKIHGGNLARQAGMHLRYVCDAVPQAASELAARLGAGVATLNQVFSDGAVQAVAIASSTDTHAELILRAA